MNIVAGLKGNAAQSSKITKEGTTLNSKLNNLETVGSQVSDLDTTLSSGETKATAPMLVGSPNPVKSAVETPAISKARKSQILQQLNNFNGKTQSHSRKPEQQTRRNQAPSALSSRGQQERQVDLQIWLLHQAMVNKLLAEPTRLPPLVAKLEQQLAAGQIRHGAYLFWSSAFALLAQPEQFRAAVLSHEPSANKYRRRTFMVGLLTEEERQQALLGSPPA